MKAFVFYDELGKDMREEEIPEDMMDLAQEYHEKLMDSICDEDDELAMLYLEGEEIPEEMMQKAIRKATVNVRMMPVCCGTSYRNKGVQELLDAIVNYMPSPLIFPPLPVSIPTPTKRTSAIPAMMSPSARWRLRSPRTRMSASCASSASTPVI